MKSADKGVIKYPKCIGSKRTASVRIETSKPVVVETAQTSKTLCRFALRSHGKVCGIGLCTQLPGNNSVHSVFNVAPVVTNFSTKV